MNPLKQYAGLRRELYIIFWGRVVTSMGALITPMMTLILKNKLGFTSQQAALVMIIIGVVQLPCTLIGGKLADRFNKKYIIVFCDLITVAGYMLCAFLPMSPILLVLFSIAGICAYMEWPAYDALVADLSHGKDRERAYSMNYLGSNLGFVLAPTMGGLLFQNHLNMAFLISSLATLSSTILIAAFVRDIHPEVDNDQVGKYEEARYGESTWKVLSSVPVLWMFVLCAALYSAVYGVGFSFLMPLNMEKLYGANGAVLFGTMTSVNALVVIIGTPLCTSLLRRLRDTSKLVLGQALEMLGYLCFILCQGVIPLYYVAMAIFTVGEVVNTLGHQPYLTRRVPASHRGRIASMSRVFDMLLQGICLQSIGLIADRISMARVWSVLVCIGVFNVALLLLLRSRDKKRFSLLYDTPAQTLPANE